jgi:F-type H+-transporting ATPase subunit epsilon
MATAPATRELRCVVVTPERALLEEPADFVALPLYDGEIGILPGRAPMVGRLGYGELRIKKDNVVKRYYVDGGFVQVRANVVTVLTSRALEAGEVSTASAEMAREKAAEVKDATQRMQAQDKARALQRMADRNATV